MTNETIVPFDFSTVSPNGRTKTRIKNFPQNGGKPISLQNEKPCSWTKLNTLEEMSFSLN